MRRTAVRLSERLKRLERDGLLAARLYSQRPPRAAYQLTAEGAELAGALRLLAHWGTRHTHRPTPRITPPAAPLSRPAGTARPATNSSTTKRKTPRRTTCNEQRPAEPAARTDAGPAPKPLKRAGAVTGWTVEQETATLRES